MLAKFSVTNFKSFKEEFVFDLTKTGRYEFNKNCVHNGVVKKALVYGANGVGKSNLGYAIFDIISHLSEKNSDARPYLHFLNAESDNPIATFKYEFNFKDNVLVYEYGKSSKGHLVFERLEIDGDEYLSVDRRVSSSATINLRGTESLKRNMGESRISVINYVKNNAILEESAVNHCFFRFIHFVDKMLFFRSLQQNNYIGLEQGDTSIADDIVKHNNVKDFEKFLNEAGVVCKLAAVRDGEKQGLAFDFNGKLIPFYEICSTGTGALSLFYFWLQRLREDSDCKFLFIDEFDAFYHYELSTLLVKRLREIDIQVILTTHNTSIMTTELLRPDCYFEMDSTQIRSFASSTDKELRAAHNLEKMYRSGLFSV